MGLILFGQYLYLEVFAIAYLLGRIHTRNMFHSFRYNGVLNIGGQLQFSYWTLYPKVQSVYALYFPHDPREIFC